MYTYMHNPGRPMVLPPHTLTFLLRVLRNDRTSNIISCKRKNKQDFQKIIENTALLPNGKALFNTLMYTDNYFKIYIIEGRGNQQLLSQAYIYYSSFKVILAITHYLRLFGSLCQATPPFSQGLLLTLLLFEKI